METPTKESRGRSNINYSDIIRRLSMAGDQVLTQSPVVQAIMMDDEEKESTSPGHTQDGSLDSMSLCSQSSIPFSLGLRSPGKVSPLRGRTMKEYEEQLGNLKKENFSLKLRIYFLEERMGQKYDKDDKEDLYKTNIELKVEAEGLKRELYDKQELLRQASTALSGLEQQFQDQLTQIKEDKDQEKGILEEKVQQLQKELDEYAEQCRDGSGRLGELTQLCGLAFSTADDSQTTLPTDLSQCSTRPNTSNLTLPLTVNTPDFSAAQPMQGMFSMTEGRKGMPHSSTMNQTSNTTGQPDSEVQGGTGEAKIAELEALVVQLEAKVHQLEGELSVKEKTNNILKGDLINLNKELKDKVEKIVDLEEEVTEKDMKLDSCMQELETRHIEIKAKEGQIQTLSDDLNRVEPEMEVKVQEIVERDRIIEEKIEQIEQQNKILVEIQITLDEKQKQIAELEASLRDANDKVGKLTQELENSCKVVQSLAEEVGSRDKDIVNLKKELKRRDKKIKDLVNELKEAMDMLRKAKWEAETSGGEDGVKEMAEEENERLWAELEQRKTELLTQRADHETALLEAKAITDRLQDQLDEQKKILLSIKETHKSELEEREASLRDKTQQLAALEAQLLGLVGDVNNREGQLKSNQDLVSLLKDELNGAKEQLKVKKDELDRLQDDLKKKNTDMQDLVNKELWERNKEVEKLQDKLSTLMIERRAEIEGLKDELDARGNHIRRLESRLKNEVSGGIEEIRTIDGNTSNMQQQSKNIPANLTLIQGGTDIVNVTARPLHVNVSNDDSAAVQVLYQEMGKIRSEAQALRMERQILSDKLSDLQKLNEQACQSSGDRKAQEDLRDELTGMKRLLEESKEENLIKDRKHDEVITVFQSQVDKLRSELDGAKNKMNKRVTEVNIRKYQEALKRYKQDNASLRKRLAESHNACDLLRTRLEELADFLEQILEMDEQGLINLSSISAPQMASLHKTLNESRALSLSLSQSLMIGMDTTDVGGDDPLSSSSLSSIASWGVPQHLSEDSVSEEHNLTDHELIGDLPDDSLMPTEDLSILPDSAYQALATEINNQIDQKTKEIDAIAENVNTLTKQLTERTQQVEEQEGVISDLRGQVDHLQDEVRNRDLQLQMGSQPSTRPGSGMGCANCLAASSQSTVHAASPLTNRSTSVYSSQECLRKSGGSCSEPLPPPPHHLLHESTYGDGTLHTSSMRELEMYQTSDRSSRKSAYSTDAAIKASSGHPGYFMQLATPSDRSRQDGRRAPVAFAGAGMNPEHAWVPVSPSESEAWSEPDRNVSLARIGLDTSALGGVTDRSLSRSRQQRVSAVLSSESEVDALHDDPGTISTNPNTSGKTPKRRSDAAELRRITAKLRAVEQLNESLQTELNIYQTLSQQMSTQQTKSNKLQSSHPSTSEKSVETHKGETANAASATAVDQQQNQVANQQVPSAFTIPAALLDEIRGLRLKLEEAINNNDHLRDQLEAALSAQPHDEARYLHLTTALQTAQEELHDSHERLRSLQSSLAEQQQQVGILQQRLKDTTYELDTQKAQFTKAQEEVNSRTSSLETDLATIRQLLEDKEAAIIEKDRQIISKDTVIQDMNEQIRQLEKVHAGCTDHKKVKELQSSLQVHESETRSEPDRNVSLARIGLDTSLGVMDGSLSQSCQHTDSAVLSSESEVNALHDTPDTISANPNISGKTPKRRSDAAELRCVTAKLQAVEQLNESLQAELSIYQTLSQQSKSNKLQSSDPSTCDSSMETHKGETENASTTAVDQKENQAANEQDPLAFTVPAALLDEIRELRLKLKEAINNNDHLRDQMEAALSDQPHDEARYFHITTALQTAQEELHNSQEKLQSSQTSLAEQQQQVGNLQQQLQDTNYALDTQKTELAKMQQAHEDANIRTSLLEADLTTTRQLLEDKEAAIIEKDALIQDMTKQIHQLEEKAHTGSTDHEREVKELQSSLQVHETRLLEVTKERLVLVGERTRMQAKIASLSTQAQILQEEREATTDSEDSERENLLRQLNNNRSTMDALQQERDALLEDKVELEKEKQLLQEEVDSIRTRADHLLARQAHSSHQSDSQQRNLQGLREAHTSMQRAYDELQEENELMAEELKTLRRNQQELSTMRLQMQDVEIRVKQLTAQLETERRLTSNLQLQLDQLRSRASVTPSPNESGAADTSDVASPESVTSIEFFHAAPDSCVVRPFTQKSPPRRSLSASRRRDSSTKRDNSMKRDSSIKRESSTKRDSSNKRDSSRARRAHWSEDKENIETVTTITTTTTTKRGRHRLSEASDGTASDLGIVPLSDIGVSEEGDGGTTSGESPDLGIGSDYHFSSLERGSTIRTTGSQAHSLPQDLLCTEPSHSSLTVENGRLRAERDTLTEKLVSTKETLKEALEKLARANHRKETVERAICKQLSKTHNVLKKAKGNLQQANGSLPAQQ